MNALIEKVLSLLKSSRFLSAGSASLYAILGGLSDWPRAVVLCVAVLGYIASETYLYVAKVKKPAP